MARLCAGVDRKLGYIYLYYLVYIYYKIKKLGCKFEVLAGLSQMLLCGNYLHVPSASEHSKPVCRCRSRARVVYQYFVSSFSNYHARSPARVLICTLQGLHLARFLALLHYEPPPEKLSTILI